jgi:hypothetical protein
MYQVYTSVKIEAPGEERHGQVGVVVSAPPAGEPVEVKFDDGKTDLFEFGQLKAL